VAERDGDETGGLRANATMVFASSRLGHRLAVVDRAIASVAVAERHGDVETAAMLRIELAACARAAGVPLVGSVVVRPVLNTDVIRASLRADALLQLGGCLLQSAQTSMLDEALAEADRLYAEDHESPADVRLFRRALLRGAASSVYRRRA
jgi:hypothetical protein